MEIGVAIEITIWLGITIGLELTVLTLNSKNKTLKVENKKLKEENITLEIQIRKIKEFQLNETNKYPDKIKAINATNAILSNRIKESEDNYNKISKKIAKIEIERDILLKKVEILEKQKFEQRNKIWRITNE